MKTLTTLLCLALLSACQNNTKPVVAPMKTSVQTNCATACAADTIPFEISAACANCMILNYQNSNPNNTVKGFQVQLADLDSVISAITNPATSKVYAMLGQKDDVEIVFEVVNYNEFNKPVFRYFDFTLPCPTACPENHQ